MTSATSPAIFAETIFLGVIGLFAALMLLHVYRSYFLEAQRLNLRFRLFALRDELETMAVQDRISEHADEYVVLRDGINGLIGQLEKVGSFFVLYLAVAKTARDQEKLRSKIEKCPELAMLYAKSYLLFAETVYKNSFFLRAAKRLRRLQRNPARKNSKDMNVITSVEIRRAPLRTRARIVHSVRYIEELGNEYEAMSARKKGHSLTAHV